MARAPETITGMKRTQWLLLALAEIVVAAVALFFARSVLFIPLKIAVTALRRWDVFQANAAYFMGMFLGCAIRIAPAAILIWHAVWVARKRIIQTTTAN